MDSLRLGSALNMRIRNLFHEIQVLLQWDWDMVVTHVYREGNQVADLLAKEAPLMDRRLYVLQNCPAVLSEVFLGDKPGK